MSLHYVYYQCDKLKDELKESIPIFIVHGLFGQAKNWHTIARALSKEYDVYSVDLRNHGSSFHSNKMDYASLSTDIAALMLQLNVTKSHFIAHSMGGKAVMTLALCQPELIHKLIIVDIAPFTYSHNFNQIVQALKSIDLTSLSSRSEAGNSLALLIDDYRIRQFLLSNLRFKDNNYSWRFNLNAIEQSIDDIVAFPSLSQIGLSNNYIYEENCLFVAGEESNYINSESRQSIKQLFPKSTIIKIKQAGHWLHAEKPEVFINIATSYFKN